MTFRSFLRTLESLMWRFCVLVGARRERGRGRGRVLFHRKLSRWLRFYFYPLPYGRGSVHSVVVAMLVGLGVTFAGGCSSFEERWGRDPKALRESDNTQDQQRIEIAKTEAMKDEQNPPEDEFAPVSVLFVNGEAITVEDVLKWIRPDLEKQMADLPPRAYFKKMLEIARQRIRTEAEGVLLRRVASKDMSEQDKERLESFVDAQVREIINKQYGGRQARYEDALREREISPTEDRARIRDEMVVAAYLQRTVGNKVAEPTRHELEKYHRDYQRAARAHQRRRMLLIDIPVGDRDATGRALSAPVPLEHARQKARRALEKIRSGTSFADAVREYSEGINAFDGGDWGWVSREGLKPRWQPAVDILYQLAEGETSACIETDQACFVVHCAEIEPVAIKSFVEMQPQLVSLYKKRQFDKLTRELVAKLYSEASIQPPNPGRFLRAVVEAAPYPDGARPPMASGR